MKLLKLVPDDTNIKFLKWRIPFFAVSILLIAASWALVLTKGLNYGVDFAGGLEVRATFTQSAEAPVGELREKVATLGYGDPVVQRFGEDNQVSIRVRLPDEDRKSTRMNSSHVVISYAVFCLKKKRSEEHPSYIQSQ